MNKTEFLQLKARQGESLQVNLLLFEGVTSLDLNGPFEVFSRMPGSKVFLVSRTGNTVRCEKGLRLVSDFSFADCPPADILCVPGGKGITGVIQDKSSLTFLQDQSARASLTCSVCTGALVLACAGLLDGYRATTHWLSLELLKLFPGVDVQRQRVVWDRDRVSAAGVSAGIDLALWVTEVLYGLRTREEIRLMMEYPKGFPPEELLSREELLEIKTGLIRKQSAIRQEREKLILRVLAGAE